MSQNKSKLTQKKSKDSSKLSTTTEKNNFSIADEVYKDVPERLDHFKKQREDNGFDDTETWHLDKTVALFLMPRLERFIQVNNGFPCGETEESYNENDEVSLDLEKERLSNAKKAAALLGEIWFDLWW